MNYYTTIGEGLTTNGTRQGWYLVRASDKARFWIGKSPCLLDLEFACDKALSDEHGWSYWIDYSLGADVEGRAAWSNLDQTDRFMELAGAYA